MASFKVTVTPMVMNAPWGTAADRKARPNASPKPVSNPWTMTAQMSHSILPRVLRRLGRADDTPSLAAATTT